MIESRWSTSTPDQGLLSDAQTADPLHEYRLGTRPNVAQPQSDAFTAAPFTAAQAAGDQPELALDQAISGLADRFRQSHTHAQRLQLLQQASQLIVRHGLNLSESAAQDFNQRMAQAGCPNVQLIPNTTAGPGEPLWNVRYRDTSGTVDRPPILYPVP